ncbi:MAG: pyruvate dehydrogenase complex dihydrolipoamide acetyltransferase [Chitinophagaceae bacterium]
MADVIRMPLLSDTMKEGVIAEWHVKVGDKINSDDVIAEVETDKATMEVIPYVGGTVLYIGPKKGEAAKVNGIIAIVGKPGEDYKPLLEKESSDKQTVSEVQTIENKVPENAVDDTALAEAKKNVTVIRMPLLSDTMKEGKIVAWDKKVGDKVSSDDVLAEVETDKATMEVIGYAEGTLLYIGVEKDHAAKVNDIIAIVGKRGANFQVILDAEKVQSSGSGVKQAQPQGENKIPQAAAIPAETDSVDGRIKASPLAKRLAEEKNIPLDQIKGTGDGGRIIKRDVDNFVPQAAPLTAAGVGANAPAVLPFVAGAAQEGYQDTPASQMRKIIARRLSESKFGAPHFYLTMEVNMDNAISTRQAMNEISPVKISFNDMIIKAAAIALRRHPAVNSSWMGDFIRTYQHIHIGSAVAIDEGLIVPVIRFADQKSLSQIAAEAKDLYDKAKNKKLQPQDFSGNTFTISNLGMMGIDEFTAIINPPDACILAVGGIKETVVAKNGEFKVANMMKLTMSCDHRVVDGAVGARFLQTLKAFIENPATMLV